MATATQGRKLNQKPPGAELWDVDGRVHLVYAVKTPSGNTVYLMWHIETMDEAIGMLGQGVALTPDRRITQAEANRLGAIAAGDAEDVINGEDPLEVLADIVDEQIDTMPWLADADVLAVVAEAVFEGREVSREDFVGTEFYDSHSQAEIDWIVTALTRPADATRISEENRDRIRGMFWEAGWQDVPASLVNYYSDQFTAGRMNETELRQRIRGEIDPHAPGASPFAGARLPEGAELVTYDNRFYIRHQGTDYLLSGPGQVARLGGRGAFQQVEALPHLTAPEGKFIRRGSRFFLQLADGKVYEATGPGQVRELYRLYGNPTTATALPGTENTRADPLRPIGEVVHLFEQGGKFEMSAYQPTGTEPPGETDWGDLLEQQPADTTHLGGEEEVRRMILEWLGPFFGAGYLNDPEFVARWAGRIRNGPQGERDVLTEQLRKLRKDLLPGYDENLTYEMIAGAWTSKYQQYAGVAPDPQDAIFVQLLQMNDAGQADQLLRKTGMTQGWEPTVSMATAGLQGVVGPQVRRSLV